jgi:RNA-binding protein
MVVVPATNPKKKSLMPSGELRRKLRGHAHALNAVVQVGKEGVTPGIVKQVTGALFDHELIKVKIGGECPQDRFEVAELLAAEPGVNLVQILGRVLVLYKRHPQKPRYEGASAAAKPPVATKAAAAKKGGKLRTAERPRGRRGR